MYDILDDASSSLLISHKPIILSIDPGTNNLGICVFQADLLAKELIVIQAYTVDINIVARLYAQHIEIVHGARAAKMYAVEYLVSNLLRAYPFAMVACESPYMGRFPQAFSALVECMARIYMAVYKHKQTMPFYYVDPSTVKRNLGVKGTSSNKLEVAMAIANCTSINTDRITLAYCDEHTTDAIAVGFTCFKNLIG